MTISNGASFKYFVFTYIGHLTSLEHYGDPCYFILVENILKNGHSQNNVHIFHMIPKL